MRGTKMNNFNDMLSKAKIMQEKMQEVQKNLKNVEVEGVSGGNSVKVILKGDYEMKNCEKTLVKAKLHLILEKLLALPLSKNKLLILCLMKLSIHQLLNYKLPDLSNLILSQAFLSLSQNE